MVTAKTNTESTKPSTSALITSQDESNTNTPSEYDSEDLLAPKLSREDHGCEQQLWLVARQRNNLYLS